MSKSLNVDAMLQNYRFSSTHIANMTANWEYIMNTKKHDWDRMHIARSKFSSMVDYMQHYSRPSSSWQVIAKEIGIQLLQCQAGAGHMPVHWMQEVPDLGFVFSWQIHSGHLRNYSYDSDNTLVYNESLYPSGDILNYSADPMQYLTHKHLKTEKRTGNLTQDASSDDTYSGVGVVFLGVELEVEKKSTTPAGIERSVIGDLTKDYAILKSDGSLNNGFEIVTAPATLAYHQQAWDKFFDKENGSARHLTSWASGRCGMHVHICRKVFTPLHLGKFTAFINNNENRGFVTTIAGRNNNSYSAYSEDRPFLIKAKMVSQIGQLTDSLPELTERKKVEAVKTIETLKARLNRGKQGSDELCRDILSGGGRGAVNCGKGPTVELRIFKGNVSKTSFFKNLEFTHAVVEFTRDATFRTKPLTEAERAERKRKNKENTEYHLHFEYFLDWLGKDTTGNYNNLKLWLQTHKITDKYKIPKQTSKTPVNKRVFEDEIRATA